MIAFASAITRPETYGKVCEPGLRRAAEPDSVILATPAIGSLQATYNHILERARAIEGLEALVLLHQDTEIADAGFCAEVRRVLADGDVGLIGCVGAVGVRSIAWWEGSVTAASFVHRYAEHGGGELPAFSWDWAAAPPYAHLGEVDTLDGFLLVLSPWTVDNVRFDEALGRQHGYDLDFCLQVRAAGKKVVTADFRAIHEHSLTLLNDPDGWVDAHTKVAGKWAGVMPGIGAGAGTWEQRALRAEAERDAAEARGHTNALEGEARARQLEHAREEAETSISWRITAPLRRRKRVGS